MKPVFKQYTNGLRLVFKKVEENRPTSLYIAVDVGSVKENDENNGISHFIEHLNFKGTEKRNAKQICVELEEKGINANAFTSKTTTCFYATCLTEKFEECFEILSDMVLNSKYDEEDIKKERQVIFEEIDMYDDDPETVAYEDFCKNFYAGSPLQKPIIGTKQTLTEIKQKDIIDYIKTNYVPQNIVISVVGNLELEDVENIVKKYIGKNFTKQNEVEKKLKSSIHVPDSKFSSITKEIAQTQVVIGFPCGNIYSEEKMCYNLLAFIFGGGMGSRLFQKVREEQGLVYSISCSPELFECGGSMIISFGTNPLNQTKAMDLVKQEIDNLIAEGVTQKELDRAKIFCKCLVVSGFETTSSIAKNNANNIIVFDRLIPVEEKIEDIEKVSLEDINRVISKVFNYDNVCGSAVSNKSCEDLFNVFK